MPAEKQRSGPIVVPVILAVLLFMSQLPCASAQAADAIQKLPSQEQDIIPAGWLGVKVSWKNTWEETLAENIPAAKSNKVAAVAAMKPPADTIAGLRAIEVYKAMIEHFPDRKEQHGQAYLAMAAICERIGLPETGVFYASKVTRECKGRPALVAEAYLRLSHLVGDAPANDGIPALYEALELAGKGGIPAGHEAVVDVSDCIRRHICRGMQYDMFLPVFARLEVLAAADPRLADTIVSLMRHFGETAWAGPSGQQKQEAKSWFWQSSNPRVPGCLSKLLGNTESKPPSSPELVTRWDVFLRQAEQAGGSRPVDPAQIQKILDLSVAAGTEAYLGKSGSHYMSYWGLVSRTLETFQDASLAALREEQDKAARPGVRAIRGWEDRVGLARLSRRYPYAASVHLALADLGECALHEGRLEEAAGAFREVIRRSNDSALCAQARIGLCLALVAGGGSRHDVETIMAAVPDNAEVAWLGTRVQAGQLKGTLLAQSAGQGGARVQSLAALPRISLALPPDWPLARRRAEGPLGDHGLKAPWPVNRIETRGRACVVSGQGHVACFDTLTSRQRWGAELPGSNERTGKFRNPLTASQYMQDPSRTINPRPIAVTGTGSQAVSEDGETIYMLSGGDNAVTALDAGTGRSIWSTAGRDEWLKLAPVNHPAASHGCVYVLAVPVAGSPVDAATMASSTGPWILVCLNGRDGSTVWKTQIAWQSDGVVDIVRHGMPVTIQGNAVYCCPGMGVVARCDARDGRLDWVMGYPPAVGNIAMADSLVYSREGSSPVLAGNRLFVAPRDSSGVMAVDVDTGTLLWRDSMVPSDRMFGVSGKALVIMSGEWLAALDVASGKPLWFRQFREGKELQCAMAGSDVVVLSGRKLHRLSADTGKTVEESSLKAALNAEYAFLADGTLVEMVLPRISDTQPVRGTIKSPLGGPLVKVARIACDSPSVVVDRSPSGTKSRFCIISGRRVLHVLTEPELKISWERILQRPPVTANIVGSRVLFSTDGYLTAVALADAAQEWTLQLPFLPYAVGGTDQFMLALPGRYGAGQVAAIDPAAGKLLWTRSLAARARFQGGISRVEFKRKEPGAGAVGVVLQTLFDDGWHAGQVELETATGRVIATSPFVPKPQDHVCFCGDALVYAGSDPAVEIAARGAAAKAPSYELPKPDAPGICEILAHRIEGGRLIAVSGVTGLQPHTPGGNPPPYSPAQSRVYVDCFDSASGQHMTRQTLQGVLYSTGGLAGYDTQVDILDRAIVVTDINGVHIFAAQQ